MPVLFWMDTGHATTVITVPHFCFEWTLRVQLQELQFPFLFWADTACNWSNYGTLFLFCWSHKTINMKANYLEVKDISKSGLCWRYLFLYLKSYLYYSFLLLRSVLSLNTLEDHDLCVYGLLLYLWMLFLRRMSNARSLWSNIHNSAVFSMQ